MIVKHAAAETVLTCLKTLFWSSWGTCPEGTTGPQGWSMSNCSKRPPCSPQLGATFRAHRVPRAHPHPHQCVRSLSSGVLHSSTLTGLEGQLPVDLTCISWRTPRHGEPHSCVCGPLFALERFLSSPLSHAHLCGEAGSPHYSGAEGSEEEETEASWALVRCQALGAPQ